MPKFLFEARYTSEGAIGLAKEGGASRREAVKKHLDALGGKLESMYFAFGDVDCFVIVDLPDNVSAAALSLAVNESGLIATKAIVLLTPEDMDKAGKKKVRFRGPGKKHRS
ncbi:MAG TPA: GYD domain-containing protein [Roseiarcus sp.]|nr:GYD domain-containing protein [Roseiarcus sp.]